MTLIVTRAETVPEILRATRGAAGYSTREIAALVGVSHGTIANWEKGLSEPTISQFVLWCVATGQPPGQLFAAVAETAAEH